MKHFHFDCEESMLLALGKKSWGVIVDPYLIQE